MMVFISSDRYGLLSRLGLSGNVEETDEKRQKRTERKRRNGQKEAILPLLLDILDETVNSVTSRLSVTFRSVLNPSFPQFHRESERPAGPLTLCFSVSFVKNMTLLSPVSSLNPIPGVGPWSPKPPFSVKSVIILTFC